MTRYWMILLMMLFACMANAQSFTGNFEGRFEDEAFVLTLKQNSDGSVTGSLKQDGESSPIVGKANGKRLTAVVNLDGEKIPFSAELSGSRLAVRQAGMTVTLTRTATLSSSFERTSAPKPQRGSIAVTPEVRINGVKLSSEQLNHLSRQYRLQFRSGDFWYDRRCGAWGMAGQPVSGLVAPNIEMGGSLRPDASHGNTGVIVNGRELPLAEVQLLQQLGPVYRGRFWLDAQGNYGVEGGPRRGNLIAAAQAQQVPRTGVLSTWDRTGVAVFGY